MIWMAGLRSLRSAADARDGAAGADAGHEVGDPAGGLLPDLGAGGGVVGGGVVGVVVLVGLEGARRRRGDAVGDGVVRVGVVRVDRGRAHDHLGAEGPQQLHLLAGDLVRHGEDASVAPAGGDHRQADAGVARGRLDDRPARLEQAGPLGRLDHGQRRAVLDAAARVEIFELGQQVARQVPAQSVEADHRRVAEQVDQRVGDVHRRAPIGDRVDFHADVCGDCLVGVEGDGQARAVQGPGHLEPRRYGAHYADGMGDVGPQVGDRGRCHRVTFEDYVVVGPGKQTRRCRAGADDDEHVHGAKGTRLRSRDVFCPPAFDPGRWPVAGGDAGGRLPLRCPGRLCGPPDRTHRGRVDIDDVHDGAAAPSSLSGHDQHGCSRRPLAARRSARASPSPPPGPSQRWCGRPPSAGAGRW